MSEQQGLFVCSAEEKSRTGLEQHDGEYLTVFLVVLFLPGLKCILTKMYIHESIQIGMLS